MLLLIGRVQSLGNRTVTPANGSPFQVRSVALLVSKTRIEWIDLAKDFDGDLPAEGDEIALRVSVNAWTSKNTGKASFGFTAWENASDRIQLAAPKAA